MPREKDIFEGLSRRERQIMDAVYHLEQATAAEIREHVPDPPSINALRRLIAILEEKGHLLRREDGPRHVFLPTVAKKAAAQTALDRVRDIFFGGSAARAAAALFDSEEKLDDEDLAMLTRLIEKARKEGR